MLKRHFFLFAAVAAVGLMVVAVVLRMAFAGEEGGGLGGPGGERGAQEVAEIRVVDRAFSDSFEVLGVARGRRSVDITSSTTELITRVFFSDGQRVAAGAPLVVLRVQQRRQRATPGTLVNPGTVIATLDDISVVRVDFQVPERYLPVLRPGVEITARADAYPGREFSGRIADLDTRIDPQTRALTARAEFPNPDLSIRPGMSMRVSVQQGQRTAAAVPEAAVQYEGSGAFVYRIASDGERSTAQRIEVQTGAVEAGMVEILQGLDAGDRVIGSGLNRIQPGAAVQVANASNGQASPQSAPEGGAVTRTSAP